MNEFRVFKENELPTNLEPNSVYFVQRGKHLSLHVSDKEGKKAKHLLPAIMLDTNWVNLQTHNSFLSCDLRRVGNTVYIRFIPLDGAYTYVGSAYDISFILDIPLGYKPTNTFVYPIIAKDSHNILGMLEVTKKGFTCNFEGRSADEPLPSLGYCFSWITDDDFPISTLGDL